MAVAITSTGLNADTFYQSSSTFFGGFQWLPTNNAEIRWSNSSGINTSYIKAAGTSVRRTDQITIVDLNEPSIALNAVDRQFYFSFDGYVENTGSTAATITQSIPLSNVFPSLKRNFGPSKVGTASGTLLTIHFNVAGIYFNASATDAARMATSGVVQFKSGPTPGVWTRQTIQRYWGYNSDATNFPTSKFDFLVENSQPTAKFLSRTSQPAGAYCVFTANCYVIQDY